MTPELDNNIINWWVNLSFEGKEQYSFDEGGVLLLKSSDLLKERTVATIAEENCELVFKTLTDKYDTFLSKVRETEVEWIATEDKLKLADKVDHLKDTLNTINAIGDLAKVAQLLAEWEHSIKGLVQVNYDAKLKLAELAESLKESTEWKETTQALKDLGDKWKLAGYVDRRRNDQLWNRIEAAKQVFFDRKRLHHKEEETDLLHTLDLKIELAEKAESLSMSEDWKATTEAYQKIMDEWKSIGRTLPKKNEELWQRIIAAKSIFFERKRENFNKIQLEQEQNYTIKMALIEKAEAMKESRDWAVTAQAYAALMDEWKKTGRVAQEKSDELWKRFIDAQEQFFEAKKKHSEATRAAFEKNFQEKSALLKRAEELKNSSRWGDVTTEMNRLFDEWKKIGPVPREHNNTLWEAFVSARKHFFNRKDANREQRKEYATAQKSARIEQAYSLVHKMKQEIAAEEERMADLQNAIDNITPGKKADELRTHLDALIADSRAKMKRMHEKLAAGEDELKAVEEKEKAEQMKNEAAE